MSHEKLYEKALDAINELYADITVDKSITREDLRSLIFEIQDLLFSLE